MEVWKDERHHPRIGDSNCKDLLGILPFLRSSPLTKLGKYTATATTSAAILVRSGERSNRWNRYGYCFQRSFQRRPLSLVLSFSVSLSTFFARFFDRDRIGETHGSPSTYVRGQLQPAVRGTTCCKNDNEVITEEIAYAIVADFPLFRFCSDTRYVVNALNRKAEIAEVAEFMESADPAFKEPVIGEIMTNIERLDFLALLNLFRLYLRAVQV